MEPGKRPRRFSREAPPGAGNLRAAAVFPPGGDAAADVPLGLVFIQDRFYLKEEISVVERQTLAEILVDRALADAESLGRGPDGGSVLYDVLRQLTGPLFNISLQWLTLPIPICFIYMRDQVYPCHRPAPEIPGRGVDAAGIKNYTNFIGINCAKMPPLAADRKQGFLLTRNRGNRRESPAAGKNSASQAERRERYLR